MHSGSSLRVQLVSNLVVSKMTRSFRSAVHYGEHFGFSCDWLAQERRYIQIIPRVSKISNRIGINKDKMYGGCIGIPIIPRLMRCVLDRVSCFSESIVLFPSGKIAFHAYGCLVQACFEAPRSKLTVEVPCTTNIRKYQDGKFWSGYSR